MFKGKKLKFFLLALLGVQVGISTNLVKGSWSAKRTISLVTIGAAAVGIYKFGPRIYNALQEKINNKINEEIVSSSMLMLTPNYVIDKLNDEEREHKFQKKARLMSSKTRIIKSLETILNDQKANLSVDHKKQLQFNLNAAKLIFGSANFIDNGMSFFTKKTQTLEYGEPNYLDQFIEDKVCKSIVLSSKPLNECTEQEKLNRVNSKEKVKKILFKKIGKFAEAILFDEQTIDMLCKLTG